MPDRIGPYLAGYGFAVLGGLLVGAVTRRYWVKWSQGKTNVPSDPVPAAMVGVVERPLYVTSLLIGQPAFIALWLGLKFGGWWKGRASATDGLHRPSIFQSFLIGNGLSLAYAGVGFTVIKWARQDDWMSAGIVMGALVLLTLLLWWGAKYVQPAGKNHGADSTD